MKKHHKQPTFAELRRAYLGSVDSCDIEASIATATANFNTLMQILAIDNIKPTSTLDSLKPNIIKRWRKHQSASSDEPRAVVNYRLNCRLRLARSVFSKSARKAYEESGITIPPALEEIANIRLFKPEARQTFKPIDATTDKKIKAEARSIIEYHSTRNEAPCPNDKRSDWIREVKVAIMVEMARLCGMTRKEIHYFRPSWIINTPQGTYIDVREDGKGFTTKHSTKNRAIPLSPEVLKRWQPFFDGDNTLFGKWETSSSPNSIYADCSKWLRRYIPDRQKSLHELRKMACSDILSRENNIFAAAQFIGDRVDTTARYYAAQLNPLKPIE